MCDRNDLRLKQVGRFGGGACMGAQAQTVHLSVRPMRRVRSDVRRWEAFFQRVPMLRMNRKGSALSHAGPVQHLGDERGFLRAQRADRPADP
jgi:hypothetical protein